VTCEPITFNRFIFLTFEGLQSKLPKPKPELKMGASPVLKVGEEIKILRLFSRLNVGGPSIHVVLLATGLGQKGYRTRLVVGQESTREGSLLEFARERGVDCVQLAALGREIHPLADFQSLFQLYRLMRQFRPAIVHTHTAKAGVLGRMAAYLAGVPVVVHTYHGHVLRGYFGPLKTRLFRSIESLLSVGTDALIAVSESVRDDLIALGVASGSKIQVVPLGLELEGFTVPTAPGALRLRAGVPAEAPLVGIVGRLVPIKDLPTFIRAAAIVHKSLPETHFAVVGDGEERGLLEASVVELGLRSQVHFFGWFSDMPAVYRDLDVVVNTSLNEGTPVALIEALAAGKPVVATRVGGTPDLLGEGSRGALVPPADPQTLAAAILDTLRSPREANARAQVGRDYVLSQHSAGRLIHDIDSLYKRLLHGDAAVA
jgi:glycosyltransferase involved in cell wall biosynthesis